MKSWKRARKKPVEIQYREPIPNTDAVLDINKGFERVEYIKTLEGTEIAVPMRDFVIKGVRGELYPIKKDIFYETYDLLDEELGGGNKK